MTSASRWGALVVASLPLASLGCSSAVAPTPTPALPPPPTPTAVASAAPAPPPPRLSPLVDLFTAATDTPNQERSNGRTRVVSTPYGHGSFTHRTYQVWGRQMQPCPVAREEGCGSFSLRTGATAPAAAGIWPAPATDAAAPTDKLVERGPFVAPHAWVAFAGGLDAVYALREGGKHIDRIDDQGKVTLFASDDAMAGWSELWVIERQGKLLVAGMGEEPSRRGPAEDESTRAGWHLAEVIEGTAGSPRRLGPLTELPMRPISSRLNAQGARTAAADGKMVAVHLPEVLALPDDGAQKDRWAMVWLEVVAPDYSWPAGKPQKGVSRNAVAPVSPKKGARHGCGGPASRGLDDASVTKRAHVTRFAGAKLLDDTVQWTAGSVGDVLSLPLTTKLEGDQLSVALPGKRPAGPRPQPHWAGDDDEELKLAHNEEVAEFTFDPVAGEGLVVIRDHQQLQYRRFDAAGRPLGEPTALKASTVRDVAYLGGKWYAIGSNPTALYNLSDSTGPFEMAAPRHGFLQLVMTDQGAATLTVEGRALRATPIGPTGVTGPATTLDELPTALDVSRINTFTVKGTSAVALIERRDSEENQDKVAWRPLSAGAAWQHVELPSRKPVYPYQVGFHEVHDDLVATIDRGDKQGFVWLRAGKSIFREVSKAERSNRSNESLGGGPLLGGGLRLPSEPGLPVADEATADLGKQCSQSVPTSATTVVLACVHATDPLVPSLRIALRTLRIDPTP